MDVRRDVFIIAATNRPDIIDKAMLRPGRLDKLLYVPLPTANDRSAILRTHTRKVPIGPDVDTEQLARDARCDGFSGADLAGLVREAAMESLRERLGMDPRSVAESRSLDPADAASTQPLQSGPEGAVASAAARGIQAASGDTGADVTSKIIPAVVAGRAMVCARHFDAAFDKVRPSVSRSDQRMYERIRASVHGLAGSKGRSAKVVEAAAAAAAERTPKPDAADESSGAARPGTT